MASEYPRQDSNLQPSAPEAGATSREAAAEPVTSSTDPELTCVIDAWSTLPAPIKAGILAMVQATGGARA